MSPLNIHPEADVSAKKRKNNKALKILLGVGALIAVPVIGSTLAASITINSGGGVEFGQGLVQAAACDSDGVTVTPVAAFVNTASAGSFTLGSVEVTGIASGCDAKTFTIRAYPTSSSTAITLSTGTGTDDALKVLFDSDGSSTRIYENSAGQVDYSISSQSSTAFKVAIATTVNASEIYKFTLETN